MAFPTFLLYCLPAAALFYLLYLLARILRSDCDLSTANVGEVDDRFYKGKVVWVLGASSGIGAAFALRAAQAGARVVVSARRAERLQELCAGSDSMLALPLDVTDRAACVAAVETVRKTYDGQIDIAVLNAGAGAECPAEEMTIDDTTRMFELNVLSCAHLTKLLIPQMRETFVAAPERGPTCLVITSSVAGKLSSPLGSSYSGTKHALQGYFNAVRLETSEFMAVTLACPGPIDTEFGAARFVGKDKPGQPKKYGKNYMTSQRCAELMMMATQARLHEAWIAPQPFLGYCYLAVYLPDTFAWLLQRKAKKMIAKKLAAAANKKA